MDFWSGHFSYSLRGEAEPVAPTPLGAPPLTFVAAPTPEALDALGINFVVTPSPEMLVEDLEALLVPGREDTVLATAPVPEAVLLEAPPLTAVNLELPAAALFPTPLLGLVMKTLPPTLPCETDVLSRELLTLLSPETRRPRAAELAEAKEVSDANDVSGAVTEEPEYVLKDDSKLCRTGLPVEDAGRRGEPVKDPDEDRDSAVEDGG